MLASFVRQESGSGPFHSFFTHLFTETGFVLWHWDFLEALSAHRSVRSFCAKPDTGQTTWWVSHLPWELQTAPHSLAHLDYPGDRELYGLDPPLISPWFGRYKELVFKEKSWRPHCHCSIPMVFSVYGCSLRTSGDWQPSSCSIAKLDLLSVGVSLCSCLSFSFKIIHHIWWKHSLNTERTVLFISQQERGNNSLGMKTPHAHKWQ